MGYNVRHAAFAMCLLVFGVLLPGIAAAGGKSKKVQPMPKVQQCIYVLEELRDPVTGRQMEPAPDPHIACNAQKQRAEALYQATLNEYNSCLNSVVTVEFRWQGKSRAEATLIAEAKCASKKPPISLRIPECVSTLARAQQHLDNTRDWCARDPICIQQNESAKHWADVCRMEVLAVELPEWTRDCTERVGDLLVEQEYLDLLIRETCGERVQPGFVYDFEEYVYSGATNGSRDWAKFHGFDDVMGKREALVVPLKILPAGSSEPRAPILRAESR